MAVPSTSQRQLISILRCQVCGDERPHELQLDHEGIVATVCTACGRTVSLPHRRSSRVSVGAYVLGGGAPLLVLGRAREDLAGAPLAAAVQRLAAAGAHLVEVSGRQARDDAVLRLASGIPVALVVNAGRRLADAYGPLNHPLAGKRGGFAAVRWVYDGDESHVGLLLAAARRRRVPLVLAVPLAEVNPADAVRALGRRPLSLDHVVVEFCHPDPDRVLAAYEEAADQVPCPFLGRLPYRWVNQAVNDGVPPALGRFLRQRWCDALGVIEEEAVSSAATEGASGQGAAATGARVDGAGMVAAARRLLVELWLPVAPVQPQAEVEVKAADRRATRLGGGPVLDTLRTAAGVSMRVARGLRNPAVGRLSSRVLTKPVRFWHEVRRDGPGVLLTVPRRVATKPVRLMRQLGRDGS